MTYSVEFKMAIEAESEEEALELARDEVLFDNADVYINGEMK